MTDVIRIHLTPSVFFFEVARTFRAVVSLRRIEEDVMNRVLIGGIVIILAILFELALPILDLFF